MRIFVAIPCFNCEKQIPRVLAGFDEQLCKRIEKIVVIDNRSTDSTVDAASKAIKNLNLNNIEIIQNDENYGLGGSHKVAFLYAEREDADYIAILHGDNQAKTEELSNLLNVVEANPNLAAVLGSRFMFDSTLEGYSFIRTWGNIGLNVLYTLLTLRTTKDLGSGINLFRLEDLHDHRYLGFSDQFTFNIDLLLDYYTKGTSMQFVPITWLETDQISNAKTFHVGWIALKTVLQWRFSQPTRLESNESNYIFKKIS